ncbi:MAG: ComEC/Rec2 family competence protein [Candidatus Nealsonbacteria bacterium]
MQKNFVFIVLGVLIGLNVLAWIGVFQLSHANLEVTFFDVGQGDAIFIETPEGHQILIDGGLSSVILEKLGNEMPFWDRTLDLIVLTHPDFDHIAGLIEVLKRYEVQNILWTGVLCETAECQEWQKLIAAEGANIYLAQTGLRISGGRTSSGRYDLNILYPFESLEGREVSNTNNTSIVARLVYGENSFLFTGDAYQSVERELVKGGAEVDSDVLKVGHHGSKNSNSQEFIGAVSPSVAVISAGKDNKYGHPHAETLAILENYGTSILRTDLNGDIKILCNSQSLKLKSGD